MEVIDYVWGMTVWKSCVANMDRLSTCSSCLCDVVVIVGIVIVKIIIAFLCVDRGCSQKLYRSWGSDRPRCVTSRCTCTPRVCCCPSGEGRPTSSSRPASPNTSCTTSRPSRSKYPLDKGGRGRGERRRSGVGLKKENMYLCDCFLSGKEMSSARPASPNTSCTTSRPSRSKYPLDKGGRGRERGERRRRGVGLKKENMYLCDCCLSGKEM